VIDRLVNRDLSEILDYFPVLMLFGPRQIGKTTLARELTSKLPKKYHYFDLEKEEDLHVLKTNASGFLESIQDDIVVLDEVQTHPPLLSSLRAVIDHYRKPSRFILLGSADPALVKGISESLAGRVIYKEINQIGLLEADAYGIAMNQHWFRGGFPEALLLKSDRMWREWTQSFISSYVYRDMNQLFGINLSS
jgi:uncharacterized protein